MSFDPYKRAQELEKILARWDGILESNEAIILDLKKEIKNAELAARQAGSEQA